MAQRRFFLYLKRMDDGREAMLLDERTARWRAPWGYSGDVAEAVKLAAENERAVGNIFNVGERESLDMEAWIEALAVAADWRGKVLTSKLPCPPPSLPLQLNLKQHLDMDTTKIRSELGYRARSARFPFAIDPMLPA
jgi:nucleoside-diphosphate-sugar epimerase